jgi:hypothetical protein
MNAATLHMLPKLTMLWLPLNPSRSTHQQHSLLQICRLPMLRDVTGWDVVGWRPSHARSVTTCNWKDRTMVWDCIDNRRYWLKMGGKSKTSGWAKRNAQRLSDRTANRKEKHFRKQTKQKDYWPSFMLKKIFQEANPVPHGMQICFQPLVW